MAGFKLPMCLLTHFIVSSCEHVQTHSNIQVPFSLLNFFLVNKLGLFSISLFPFFFGTSFVYFLCSIFFFFKLLFCIGYSLVAQMVKNSPAMWETCVQSLSWEDPLEKA